MSRLVAAISLVAACGGGPSTDDAGPVDADQDGHLSDVDCDDTDPDIHPGASDTWYDGVDADCAGDDDFDRDRDGYRSDQHGGDDCNDGTAAISPGVAETPYDGVDNDCDPSTPDVDPDQDGFLIYDDCNDDDPTVFPGAPETVGDGVDGDCDGEDDSAAWQSLDEPRLDAPRLPRAAVTTEHLGLVLAAAALHRDGEDPIEDVGVSLFLDLDQLGDDALVFEPRPFLVGVTPTDLAVESAGDSLFVGSAFYNAAGLASTLQIHELRHVPLVGYPPAPVVPGAQWFGQDLQHVDVALDRDGTPWACGAEDTAVAFVRGDTAFPSPSGLQTGVDGSTGCWFGPGAVPPLSVYACGEDACDEWVTDPDGGALSAGPTAAAGAGGLVREQDGVVSWLAAPPEQGLRLGDGTRSDAVLQDLDVIDGQATWSSDGTLWAVALVEDGPRTDVVLEHRSPQGVSARTWIPVRYGGVQLSPTGVTLAVTDQRLLLAVTATGFGVDRPLWMVMAR